MKIILNFHILLLLCTQVAFAGKITEFDYKEYTSNFENSSVKSFNLYLNKYKAFFSNNDISIGTRMYAEYKTKNISQLEDYSIVQYIKGCYFDSKLIDGKITNSFGSARKFFGELITFRHKEWVIDSVDTDPIYNSTENSRHGAYRWNEADEGFSDLTEHYFSLTYPDKPRLYVRDLPSAAATYNPTPIQPYMSVKNASLKFKTCLFKTSDVPRTVSSPKANLIPKAIKCYEWDNSFIYNFDKKKYESPKEIDSICL